MKPTYSRESQIRILTKVLESPAGYTITSEGITVGRSPDGIGWTVSYPDKPDYGGKFVCAKDAATAFTLFRWKNNIGEDWGETGADELDDKKVEHQRMFYTTGEAALALGIPSRTFRRYVFNGRVQGEQHQITGRWVISHRELVKFAKLHDIQLGLR